ncbi:uncharacterized protein [Primulina eburnea]|uniref:uncharacterized protein isoform X2 n=1 Tax=Primulina eburnea TaxID=1245227 RepID=UPI003C6C2855
MEIRKRKPFSDITNALDLIPTSTLRKLVSSSGSNSNLALKPPISILKPDYGFRGQKVCPDPSPTLNARSDISTGSSVNNARAVNSRTVRFQSRKFPAASISREMGNKDIVYNGRHATNEFKNERKTSAMTDNSSTPLAKKKDKRMAIARQVSFSPPRRIGKPCSSLENTEENVMENLSLFSGSFDKVKGFRKGIIKPSSCSHEKTENRNANLIYSGCLKNKTEELGNGITNHSSYSFDKKKDEGEVILELPGLSVQKTKAVGKAALNYNGFLVEETKEKLKSLKHSVYSHEKAGENGKAIIVSVNMVEGSSAAVAVNYEPARRKTVKRKKDSGVSSCPLMRRTQKILNDAGEARGMKSSKSLTVPRPKYNKQQCPQVKSDDESCLPLDFIEQQRAYFKDVDEFELAEEEISQDELD